MRRKCTCADVNVIFSCDFLDSVLKSQEFWGNQEVLGDVYYAEGEYLHNVRKSHKVIIKSS